MIMDSLDAVMFSSLVQMWPRSEYFKGAKKSHALAWRSVIRDDYSFKRLVEGLEPQMETDVLQTGARNEFLLGRGVRYLYDGNGKVSSRPNHVILSWTQSADYTFSGRNSRMFNKEGKTSLPATDSSSAIQLLLGVNDPGRPIFENCNFSDVLEKKNERFTIPCFYILGDEEYLVRDILVDFRTPYSCSFWVGDRKIRLDEDDEDDEQPRTR